MICENCKQPISREIKVEHYDRNTPFCMVCGQSDQAYVLIETLARLEHEQWVEWSKALVAREKRLSMNRIERWKKLWIPYDQLTEEQKEQDRVYARKVLAIIKP